MRGPLFALLMLLSSGALAAVGGGWKLLELPDKRPAEFARLPGGAIEVRTAGSVAFLYREAPADSVTMSWRWRVDAVGPSSDPTAEGRDDRPLAVHLWFPDETMQAGLRGALAELMGYPSYGRVLTYMWAAADAAKGTRFANPYMEPGQGAVIVLRDAGDGIGAWREERIDIVADYGAAFGSLPLAPSYVALSGDSDDLGGATLGRVADLMLQ